MIFIYSKDSKTPKITQFGALAGQIQHMAAQKVGLTPRLLRQVTITGMFQAQFCYVGLILRIFVQLSYKRESYGHLLQQPRREPYFLSSHMLCLTSQRTKPGDF